LGILARRRLEARGVDRIYGGGECTFDAADRYFSYRRDGVTGRQAALIWLETP
jgi:polyphenol oxidase